jgi:methylated-DNA-[protein]-cysteine S-methyltransferase
MNLLIDRIESPLGTILLVSDGKTLRALDFSDYEDRMNRLLRLHWPAHSLIESRSPAGLSDRIRAYFDGDLTSLDRVSVETGGTPFQQEVWSALRKIPAGTTISYGELAARVGRPTAIRAVGSANASNPIPIVIPCHRVIGADGTLTGYGGGLNRKRWLLAHEGLKFPPDNAASMRSCTASAR